jgi:hypothetical protein
MSSLQDKASPQDKARAARSDLGLGWVQFWQKLGEKNLDLWRGESDGSAFPWQIGWQRLSEAHARLIQGLVAVAQHQGELLQEILANGFNDLAKLHEGPSGKILPAQQFDLAWNRFQRMMSGMREVNDELFRCLFESGMIALGGEAEKRPARKPGETARTEPAKAEPGKAA